MRALLTAVGTRGDVQPALALALELRKLGHEARLCISPNFVAQAQSLGFEAVPMGVEMRLPAQGSAPPKLTPEELRRLRESMPDLIADQFETVGAPAAGCDVILGANAHQYAAPSIAEHLGIGCVTAVYAPVAIPSTDLPPPPLPGAGEATTETVEQRWRGTARSWNERALDRINQNRARLGLAPIHDVLDYVLTNPTWLAADAALAPVPTTPGREIFQTGSWVLADDRPLPPDLEAFLEQGEPPIFVGFGSMPTAKDTSRILIGAARAAGRRILISKGWADLDLLDDAPDCAAVGDVSHDRLFPRVAAVVHHGGAGTTAAAARAGVPQVITPMFNDQFYWSSRIVDLGIGTTTPHASLTEASLTGALREVLAPTIADRARTLAGQIGRDGAKIAARRLVAEYGPSGSPARGARRTGSLPNSSDPR
ncbi:MAG TPA: glycosyltransferase [Thermoanaerobaculia bacterium]|nr:glycosyltransferase [Thermoanaerobaculia bacterium]